MYLGFLERVLLFLSRVHHLGLLGLPFVHHVVHVQLFSVVTIGTLTGTAVGVDSLNELQLLQPRVLAVLHMHDPAEIHRRQPESVKSKKTLVWIILVLVFTHQITRSKYMFVYIQQSKWSEPAFS